MSILLVAAALAACVPAPPPPPEPAPAMSVALATELPPPPAITLAERIRQEGWLIRFWEQLTAAQRRRVTTRLRQNIPPLAKTEAEAAPIWDALGLPERDALVFGAGLGRWPPAPPASPPSPSQPGPAAARSSRGS